MPVTEFADRNTNVFAVTLLFVVSLMYFDAMILVPAVTLGKSSQNLAVTVAVVPINV
jgi:hypothetical protein